MDADYNDERIALGVMMAENALDMTMGLPEGSGFAFSIQIMGFHNPAIHHPAWYKLCGFLSEAEFHEAVSKYPVMVSPQSSQFQTSSLAIMCQPDFWMINAQQLAFRAKILEIAGNVFAKLSETPIRLFAFDFGFHIPTSAPSAGSKLADRFSANRIGVIGSFSLASITFTSPLPVPMAVKVEQSIRKENELYIGVSFTHLIQGNGHFDLAPLLEKHFETNFNFAVGEAKSVVERFDANQGE